MEQQLKPGPFPPAVPEGRARPRGSDTILWLVSVRIAGFTLIALVFVGRTSKQFWVLDRRTITLAAVAIGLCAVLGPLAAVVLPTAASCWVAWRVSRQPGDGVGHRAGWEGYEGQYCENTIEGMQELVKRDNAGVFTSSEFPYLEFDVQETKDGQLVVFHDGALTRAFPQGGINEEPLARLGAAGLDYETASVQDLTAGQLQSLHIAGRACMDAGIRRSLAVEIKLLITDNGRQELIDCVRWYLDTYGRQLEQSPWRQQCYGPLGWAGAIAFPHFFAASYGEYGSDEWRHWAGEFRQQGVKARACHFHDLTLVYGA